MGRIIDTDKWYPLNQKDKELMNLGWKYRVVLNQQGVFEEASRWCIANLIKDSYTWVGYKFFFKNEGDAVWFKLLWL
jgi:hypothetical protein